MKKAVLFILLLISCGVKQPTQVEKEASYGSIYVTSGQFSAQIFLDGQNTGKSTPDTLKNVETGLHKLTIRKNGYRSNPDSVLVEVKENQLSYAEFELIALSNTGFVILQSLPANAPIFVDGNETGLYTPDTLTLELGTHQIELRKNGYLQPSHEINVEPESYISINDTLVIEQRILLEGFANVSCSPCVAAAINLHDFHASQQAMPFVIMEYYVSWPSPNDPFYLESPEQVNERVRYYSITGVPALKIDGTITPYPGIYSEIVNGFEQAMQNHNSNYGISIQKSFTENHLTIKVEIFSFSGDFAGSEEKLFVAIIENDIHYSNPPGSNGLKDFSFVFRKFLSSAKGDDLPQGNQQAEFVYEFDWPDWNYDNCQVIAFIQNRRTKKVIQTSVN